MQELIQSDIFFFVSTVALVIISLVLITALIYVVMILRSVKRLIDKVESKALELVVDIDDLRAGVRSKAETASRIISAFSVAQIARKFASFIRPSSSKKRDKSRDEENED